MTTGRWEGDFDVGNVACPFSRYQEENLVKVKTSQMCLNIAVLALAGGMCCLGQHQIVVIGQVCAI